MGVHSLNSTIWDIPSATEGDLVMTWVADMTWDHHTRQGGKFRPVAVSPAGLPLIRPRLWDLQCLLQLLVHASGLLASTRDCVASGISSLGHAGSPHLGGRLRILESNASSGRSRHLQILHDR